MSMSKAKKAQRELAIKKARRNRILIIIACVLAVAGIAAFFIIRGLQRGTAETYIAEGMSLNFYENGKFSANLSHGAKKSGSYTKTSEDGKLKVSFVVKGNTVIGWIDGDNLTLPTEWDDEHGHSTTLIKEGSDGEPVDGLDDGHSADDGHNH